MRLRAIGPARAYCRRHALRAESGRLVLLSLVDTTCVPQPRKVDCARLVDQYAADFLIAYQPHFPVTQTLDCQSTHCDTGQGRAPPKRAFRRRVARCMAFGRNASAPYPLHRITPGTPLDKGTP